MYVISVMVEKKGIDIDKGTKHMTEEVRGWGY